MIKSTGVAINNTLCYMKELEAVQEARLRELADLKGITLNGKRTGGGRTYYCAKAKGETHYKYLGDESCRTVNDIKEYRYTLNSLKRIAINIDVLEKTLRALQDIDYDCVNESLPAIYRNPQIAGLKSRHKKASAWKAKKETEKAKHGLYMTDELKIRTDDGQYVRSKSEAMIYNHLLSVGATFVYEMPTEISGSIYRPDFVVLSETDYETEILIEHQGLMTNEDYRGRFFDKYYGYLSAGYIQGINIFYTFDSLDGGFDKSPIEDIIRTRIKPRSIGVKY